MARARSRADESSSRRGAEEQRNIGLEAAGVRRPLVSRDDKYLDDVPRARACGDIQGGWQFTPVAAPKRQARRNMLFPEKSAALKRRSQALSRSQAHNRHDEAKAIESIGKDASERTDRDGDVDRAIVDRVTARSSSLSDSKEDLGAQVMAANASTHQGRARARKASASVRWRRSYPYP